ncbi:putative membrane protein [Clostridium bornimense]|uniref:Putative membrane protein n=1 Tax=Clostridium bornimense TaxID=1216932 RepID=W6SG98_9CLOT|nr:hypothetical protein [Clostridium bornimense]CDM68735.1 putative membrane protein [Clostridium bornimense]
MIWIVIIMSVMIMLEFMIANILIKERRTIIYTEKNIEYQYIKD